MLTVFSDFHDSWTLPDGRTVLYATWEAGLDRGDRVAVGDGEDVKAVGFISGVLDRGYGLFMEVVLEEEGSR
jgi:hypothetical protein